MATRIPYGQLVFEGQQMTDRRAGYYNQVKCRFRLPGSHIGSDEPEPRVHFGRSVTLSLRGALEHFGLFLEADYLEAQARTLLSQRQGNPASSASQFQNSSRPKPLHHRDIEFDVRISQMLQVVLYGMAIQLAHSLSPVVSNQRRSLAPYKH
jgi:hypothetical protein